MARQILKPKIIREVKGKKRILNSRQDKILKEEIVKETTVNRGDGFVENVKLVGELRLELRDKHGRLKEDRLIKNTITDAGKAAVAGLMVVDVGETGWDYIAIGTGTPGATALGAEISSGGGERRGEANVTGTRVTTTVTDDTGQWVTTFTFTSGFAVTEAGLFNAAAAGDMLASQSFSALNVVSGDTLTITWKVVVG